MTHPQTRRAARKEPTNFIHYPTSALRSRMHFPIATGGFLTGEASVEYFIHPEAAQNIRAVVPQAKLIFLFRDPIKRAWSDYQMFRKSGHEKGTFSAAVENEMRWLADRTLDPLIHSAAKNTFSPVRYLFNGMYARVLQNWLAVFPREQCLFLISEDFFCDGRAVSEQVQKFLGLPFHDPGSIAHAREGSYAESIDPALLEKLRSYFVSHNQALEELLQIKLPW